MKEPNHDPTPRALITELDEVHALIARAFRDELARCRTAGEAPQAAFLAQAIKFLKDNGVDVPASAPRIDTLAAEMPDFDALEKNVIQFPSTGTNE